MGDRAGGWYMWGVWDGSGWRCNHPTSRPPLPGHCSHPPHGPTIPACQVFLTPTHLGIAMEYAAGGTLFARLEKVQQMQNAPLNENIARFFYQQVRCWRDSHAYQPAAASFPAS